MSLNLNLKIATVMSSVEKLKFFSDGEDIRTVNNYISGGSHDHWQLHQWRDKENIGLSKPEKANMTQILDGLEVWNHRTVKLL